ncbi:MAG: peptidylprolyl isomerase [Sedimentisphaerales bacterium]|nr:peptidylprolyl isomerase [Sedimentisphaerales bacterium]
MALIINGERIEDSDIEVEVLRLRPDYERVFADQPAEEREAQLLEWSKENVIERVVMRQAASDSVPAPPEKDVEAAFANLKEQYADEEQMYKDFEGKSDEQIKEEISRRLQVQQKMAEICKGLAKPSKEAIAEYYNTHQAEFTYGEQARVAHIVKYVNWQNDEETAYKAISEAHAELAGGASFELVVDKHTDCADSGGDLGVVMRGRMVEEFEDVVFNLGVGEVSEIFRTRFGFHIAKVYDKKPASVAKLEDVKERIVETLMGQVREEAVNEFIDGLKEKAVIEEA